jgi:DNA-binding GntR family transcriptional regulator
MEQIYDLMGVLEGLAVRVGTVAIQQKSIERIEKLVRKMEITSDPYRFYQYNLQFHNAMCSLSSNVRLIRYMETLRAQARRISLHSFYYPGQIKASIQEHRKVLDAIKEMDPLKAEKLVRNHYLISKNRLIKYLNRSL